MKSIPVYRYPWSYACENGEEDAYRLSLKTNIACRDSIETAIQNHTHQKEGQLGTHFDAAKAAAEVVQQYGIERTAYVVANTIRHKLWDGRFAPANFHWAKQYPFFADSCGNSDISIRFIVNKPHTVLLDAFATHIRKLSDGSRTLKK